jgi:hypothetical protein
MKGNSHNYKAQMTFVFFLFLSLAGTVNAEIARGVVFEDLNRNGVREPDEPGVSGICVSNGREVVQTGAEGRWELPVDDDTILFVIKPSGFSVAVNDLMNPQFHYIHKPSGSPALEVPGVAPTGPLPESIDFPLHRVTEPERFEAVFFADTQARGLREVNFVSHDVVVELVGTEALFGITLGDLLADGPALLPELTGAIAQIGIPWYNVIGNHDNNRDAVEDHYSDESFERFFGPATYAFEYGQAVFIALDNVYVKPEGGHARRFTEGQIEFVRNYLAFVPEERLIVLMMHIPVVSCENGRELLGLISERPHTFSISGHTHEQAHLFLEKRHGWEGPEAHHHLINATVSGSWWCGTFDEVGIPHATMNDGAPNGYSIITFDGNRYSIRFKAARRPDDYQMNIYLPDDIAQGAAAETEVLVNVFAGSARSTVEMRFGSEGAWIPLEQTRGIDPECLRMHLQNEFLNEEVFGWKMDYPSKTNHLWKGPLPANPSVGTHLISVRTTDMFGQTYTAHRVVRIQ